MASELEQALREAWMLAYGERSNELKDERRARLLDERGLHPWSVVFGTIIYLESQLDRGTEIPVDDDYTWNTGTSSPHEMRDAARQRATQDWLMDVGEDHQEAEYEPS